MSLTCECCDRRRDVELCADSEDPDIVVALCAECRRELGAVPS